MLAATPTVRIWAPSSVLTQSMRTTSRMFTAIEEDYGTEGSLEPIAWSWITASAINQWYLVDFVTDYANALEPRIVTV